MCNPFRKIFNKTWHNIDIIEVNVEHPDTGTNLSLNLVPDLLPAIEFHLVWVSIHIKFNKNWHQELNFNNQNVLLYYYVVQI